MNRVFLAYPFREHNKPLVDQIQRVIGSHQLAVVTGEALAGEDLSEAVLGRIVTADALVGLATAEDTVAGSGEKRTTQWVVTELTAARSQPTPLSCIALIEDGVAIEGLFASHHHIRFDRANPAEALTQLSATIGRWKALSPSRYLKLRLEPPEAADFAISQTAKCQYRFVNQEGKPETEWRAGTVGNPPGGVFLTVRGIRADTDSIEVQIADINGVRWRSKQLPQEMSASLGKVV